MALHKMTSQLLGIANAVPKLAALGPDEQKDLLMILDRFGALIDDPVAIAREHPNLTTEVEFLHARVTFLCDKAVDELAQAKARAYLDARSALEMEGGGRPTEDLIKSRAALLPPFVAGQIKATEWKQVQTLVEGLRRALYSRAELIKTLLRGDAFGEA